MLQTYTPDKIHISNIGIGYRDLKITIRPISNTYRQPALYLGEDRIALLDTPTPFDDLLSAQIVRLLDKVLPVLQRDIQLRLDMDAEREALILRGIEASLEQGRREREIREDEDISALEESRSMAPDAGKNR